MEIDKLAYTPAMLARLVYSHAAYELSERLVSEASTHSDSYGRGAFLTEEALATLSEAEALLEAAVVADRTRGASWQAVAEALDVSAERARERFAQHEREFREAVLFPHRYPENGALGYTVAPYAVEEPDWVRERLDGWVVKHRRSSAPDRDEPQPVTRGLVAMSTSWIAERIGPGPRAVGRADQAGAPSRRHLRPGRASARPVEGRALRGHGRRATRAPRGRAAAERGARAAL